jgi:hypothetical protein
MLVTGQDANSPGRGVVARSHPLRGRSQTWTRCQARSQKPCLPVPTIAPLNSAVTAQTELLSELPSSPKLRPVSSSVPWPGSSDVVPTTGREALAKRGSALAVDDVRRNIRGLSPRGLPGTLTGAWHAARGRDVPHDPAMRAPCRAPRRAAFTRAVSRLSVVGCGGCHGGAYGTGSRSRPRRTGSWRFRRPLPSLAPASDRGGAARAQAHRAEHGRGRGHLLSRLCFLMGVRECRGRQRCGRSDSICQQSSGRTDLPPPDGEGSHDGRPSRAARPRSAGGHIKLTTPPGIKLTTCCSQVRYVYVISRTWV